MKNGSQAIIQSIESLLRASARNIAPYPSLAPIRKLLLRWADGIKGEKTSLAPILAEKKEAFTHFDEKKSSLDPSLEENKQKANHHEEAIPPLSSSNIKIPSRFENIEELRIDKELVKKLSYSYVKRQMAVPLEETEAEVTVATTNPFQSDLLEELRFFFKKNIRAIHASPTDILKLIHNNYQHDEASASEFLELSGASQKGQQAQADSIPDESAYDLLEDSSDLSPAIKLLNFIVSEAIKHNASDIHFDPEESGLHIRYRVDGVLQTRMIPPQELESPLVTRLKVMARMDIAERRLPQDGRIKMRLGMKSIDFRVSTLPVTTGERVVLRILDKGNIVLGLDQIGMPLSVLEEFRREISSSEGMILVTGPTGSGKTTTLYSALSELKNDEVNIMTIEDPVEYRLAGIAQMGVHPKIGLNFSTGLRHILRQDPDIIMIGEIRDKETAEIAIQSALTGHLVLSTLHTNDAPSAITRLVDMGVEPYLISSCCIGALAQRLVRRLCDMCHGNTALKNSCPVCLGSGFSGRHAIYELMPLSNAIKRQILQSPDATKLKDLAKKEGMKTLLDHGKELVRQGITTEEEVWRVTRSGENDANEDII